MSVKALIYQCFKTTSKNAHNSWPYIAGDRHHDFTAIKIFLASLLHQRAHMFFCPYEGIFKEREYTMYIPLQNCVYPTGYTKTIDLMKSAAYNIDMKCRYIGIYIQI